MNHHKLEEWINPKYVIAYDSKRLKEYVSHKPFAHVILDDFFQEDRIQRIEQVVDESALFATEAKKGLSVGTNIHWGAFADIETVRFLYSPAFRSFLTQLFGVRPKIMSGFVPQINAFQPGSRGFAIHNDADEPKDLVMLVNLNKNIPTNGGGELCLYKESADGFTQVKSSAPKRNRLVCFQVSSKSWHKVSDLQGNWERKNVVFDWKIA